jgi:hypothetical protein
MSGRAALILLKAPTSCSLRIGRSFVSWRTSNDTNNRASEEPSRKSSPRQPHADFVYGPTRKGQAPPPPKVEHKNFAKLGGGVVSSMFINNQAGPFEEDDFARGLRVLARRAFPGPPPEALTKSTTRFYNPTLGKDADDKGILQPTRTSTLRRASSGVTSGQPFGTAAKTNNPSSITLDKLFRLRRESAKAKKSLQARIGVEG